MKRFNTILMVIIASVIAAQCGSNTQNDKKTSGSDSIVTKVRVDTVVVFVGVNNRGVGRFRDIQLQDPPNAAMVAKGKAIYQSKCFACHKLSSEMLVGPGWEGVTRRRTPEWIMNWVTNTRVMLDKDLAAQAEMAVCLIRMPNQDLTDEQARNVLEFMRQNDSQNK
jgi:mono/diheme cytochrome c family protein